MGVDVVIKARPTGPITEEEFTKIVNRFREAYPDPDYEDGEHRYPDIVWDPYDPVPTIEVDNFHRYYGVGYERGHWPAIRALGDWIAEALKGRAEVRYGNDAADEWEYLTPWAEARAESDAHWEAVENRPYREGWTLRDRP